MYRFVGRAFLLLAAALVAVELWSSKPKRDISETVGAYIVPLVLLIFGLTILKYSRPVSAQDIEAYRQRGQRGVDWRLWALCTLWAFAFLGSINLYLGDAMVEGTSFWHDLIAWVTGQGDSRTGGTLVISGLVFLFLAAIAGLILQDLIQKLFGYRSHSESPRS